MGERRRLRPREAAVGVVERLRAQGHEAYFAGGCVRDALLGLRPKDYDVATDALPGVVQGLFARTHAVGEAFGVVLVYEGGQAVEVATFRTEAGYTDKRRPDQVSFTDARHDAMRRDFTINGLFADPLERDETGGDRIINYVGGREDLRAGLVRAIGEPAERFGEDYLRMLRAPRFAARFDFQIEQATAAAIVQRADELGQISRERIGQEMLAMFSGPGAARAAGLVQALKLDGPTLDEAHWAGPLRTLEALEGGANYPTRLAGWMIDRHGRGRTLAELADFVERAMGQIVQRWRRALCLSNEHRDRLVELMRAGAQAAAWEGLGIAQRKRLLARSGWSDALRLLRALDDAKRVQRIEAEAGPLLSEGVCPQPLVSGDDLIAMGLRPGPAFKRILDGVYDAQLEHRVRSREEGLAWAQRHGEENDE